jgi:hypothetical protein
VFHIRVGGGRGGLDPRGLSGPPSDGERNYLPDVLLTYLRANPGHRAEQIAAALAMNSRTLRPAMKRLIAAGQVRSEGQRRSTTYAECRVGSQWAGVCANGISTLSLLSPFWKAVAGHF